MRGPNVGVYAAPLASIKSNPADRFRKRQIQVRRLLAPSPTQDHARPCPKSHYNYGAKKIRYHVIQFTPLWTTSKL
jgi:hypothetical protein